MVGVSSHTCTLATRLNLKEHYFTRIYWNNNECDWHLHPSLKNGENFSHDDIWCVAQFCTICIILKTKKHPWRSVTFSKVAGCNFIESNTPPWVLFTFLKLYKCHQIAQNINLIRDTMLWNNSSVRWKVPFSASYLGTVTKASVTFIKCQMSFLFFSISEFKTS